MKRRLSPAWAMDNRNEWDFSALVDRPNGEQWIALEWEMMRENIRAGNADTLRRALRLAPPELPIPWLSLSEKQRAKEIGRATRRKSNGVRELTPKDYLKFVLQFGAKPMSKLSILQPHSGNPVSGDEEVYILAVRWGAGKAEEVLGQLMSWARDRRAKVIPKNLRMKGNDPMVALWNLACYRLKSLGGLTNKQISAKLCILERFGQKHPGFKASAVKARTRKIRGQLSSRWHLEVSG